MADEHVFKAKCLTKGKGCQIDAKYICMHCGRPVCASRKCHVMIYERRMFSKIEIPKENKAAVHCIECVKLYHPFYLFFKPFSDFFAHIGRASKEKFGSVAPEEDEEDESETDEPETAEDSAK
ncbi:hypothetical protein JXJ21_00315 [candidate division KSB1 bacterium]|nr:hypothetical protein [candidate division KSB1 bacterium]